MTDNFMKRFPIAQNMRFAIIALLILLFSCKQLENSRSGSSSKSAGLGSSDATNVDPKAPTPATAPKTGDSGTPAASNPLKTFRVCVRKSLLPMEKFYTVLEASAGVVLKIRDKAGQISIFNSEEEVKQFRKSIIETGAINFPLPFDNYRIAFCDARNSICNDPKRIDWAPSQFDDNGGMGGGRIAMKEGTTEVDEEKTFVNVNFERRSSFGNVAPNSACD